MMDEKKTNKTKQSNRKLERRVWKEKERDR